MSALQSVHILSFRGVLVHLPVSMGERWFLVRNAVNYLLFLIDKYEKYAFLLKVSLKIQ